MKITLLLLLVSIASVYAVDSYAQATKLTLQFSDRAIKEVLYEVEEQSEFRFFYNENVNVEQKTTVDIKNKTVIDVLDQILEDTDIQYRVIGRQIALYNETEGFTGLSAQQSPVSGKVTSAKGEPLPGVTVVINGTSTGTVTGVDGAYSINALGNDILTFSFIGMKSQEVAVNNRTSLNVVLEEENIGVEEVVVIGYGTRQKKDLTGAVSQINAEEITKQVSLSPQLSMQGKMAGVFVSNPGSDPNSRPTIRIRGVSTLGYNDPLYVVDGIPLTEGGATEATSRMADQRGTVNVFNMINPNDIESISVLKDASATAIYGVRASNGVILITTKRGSEGKVKVNLSASYGIQNINKEYDMATMDEFVSWTNEAWANNPALTPNADYKKFFDVNNANYLGNSPDYTQKWLDATLVKNAPIQDYNLSVSGGNSVSNYAVGAGYSSQEDVIWKSNFDRYSFFLNSDHKLNRLLMQAAQTLVLFLVLRGNRFTMKLAPVD
jgi:TonB-linked SusC/RagA family outer membrane protein